VERRCENLLFSLVITFINIRKLHQELMIKFIPYFVNCGTPIMRCSQYQWVLLCSVASLSSKRTAHESLPPEIRRKNTILGIVSCVVSYALFPLEVIFRTFA